MLPNNIYRALENFVFSFATHSYTFRCC